MTKITDYDEITDLDFTNNCTTKENNFYIFIPISLLTKPCGSSFLCLTSLMIYTLTKPLITNR